ncbi:IclR family transcriptional regulator [Endozoicomonadaceae bacterium StTr2]
MSRSSPHFFPESGIQTLDRSMLLVELVARSGNRGMTAEQLEEASGFSMATVYRMTQALKKLGLLRQLRNRGPYLLGHQLIVWGSAAGQTQHIKRAAAEPLRCLVEQFNESFFLFVPDGLNVLCLDIKDGSSPARSYARNIGSRIRHGLGQASIAILSHLGDEEYEQILSHNSISLQRNFGINRHDIDQAVSMCRHLGITGGVEGRHPPEFTGLASPILDPLGQPVAALSCSLPRHHLTETNYRSLCAWLRDQSNKIEQQLFGIDE